jgi:predicted phage terminase large subunit-like protein
MRRDEYDALLRQDFHAFVLRSFQELNPQTTLLPNWHIEVVAAKLRACLEGRIRRLAVLLPPRHLKSHIASVAFPAFVLGHNPATQILCVSYGEELSQALSRDCRTLMMSELYTQLFLTRLSPEKQAVAEFTTTQRGRRLARSVGGPVTGRGADFIIIDDAVKPGDALSDALRRAANNYYDHTLYSRLNDKNTGCIIIVMQRLHEDDLLGHVLGLEDWEVVCLPAIAEQDEEHVIETAFGTRRIRRRAGEALHPQRESLETLARIRATIGEWNFAAQYRQRPAPLGGGLVKAEWFRRYEPHQLPDKFDRIIQSWDTANKATELSDYSVCTTWGQKDRRLYLIHVLRKRLNYPELKRAVREQWQAFDANVILIEDKASGTQLIQELIQEGIYAVRKYEPQADKTMRMHAQTGMIENGFVYLPSDAHWLDIYLHEVTTFPGSTYDDQVDSTAQALEWVSRSRSEPHIIEFYRLQCAARAQQSAGGKNVRIKRPPKGADTVILRSGKVISVGVDGVLDLPEADAVPLIRAGWSRLG